MTRVTLESGSFGWDYLLVADDGRDLLIQTDTDYPGTASNIGWSPARAQRGHTHVTVGALDLPDPCEDEACEFACAHDATDGTVDCPDCGAPASAFIASAQEWLDEHIGDSFDDPGYFDEEG